jgi:hypothetical protein
MENKITEKVFLIYKELLQISKIRPNGEAHSEKAYQ